MNGCVRNYHTKLHFSTVVIAFNLSSETVVLKLHSVLSEAAMSLLKLFSDEKSFIVQERFELSILLNWLLITMGYSWGGLEHVKHFRFIPDFVLSTNSNSHFTFIPFVHFSISHMTRQVSQPKRNQDIR